MAHIRLPNGDCHELDPRGPTTIGSSEGCKVRIAGVAEQHCVIKPLKDKGFGLKDLASGKGTSVNGRAVRAVRLSPGDEIRIGGALLVFEEPSPLPGAEEAPPEPPGRAPAGRTETLPVGHTIGGYEIQGLLGHGGMGTVYQALQLSLHRQVALKILKRELGQDPNFVQSFISEARAAARFNHPNIVQVFDVDELDGQPFFSMELLQESLEERIRRTGRLGIEEAVRSVRDAARGLAYADQLELVHRDIKPDNLMLTGEGLTKICDLGLAADPEVTKKGKIAGTPHFISPEQIRGGKVDHRSDIYSLGCTFFRILTGKTPFKGKTVRDILKAHLETPPPSLREVLPEAPEDLESVIARMMAKDPGERYEHASELAEDLEVIFQKHHRGHRQLVAVLALAVLGLGGGFGYLLLQNDEPEVIIRKEDDPAKAEREKALKERNAEVAFLRIPGEGSLLARAARFEELARKFPGTTWGEKAKGLAASLRSEQARIQREAEEKRIREEALAGRIRNEGGALLLEGRLGEAWSLARRLAGPSPHPSPVEEALASLGQDLLGAWKTAASKAFQTLGKELGRKGSDLEKEGKAFEEALSALGLKPASGLREADPMIREWLGKGRQLVEAERQRRKAARAEALRRILSSRRSLLLGPGGLISDIRKGRFAEARKRIETVEIPEAYAGYWRGLRNLSSILGRVQGRITDLCKEAPPLVLEGESFQVASYAGGVLHLELQKGRRKEERRVELFKQRKLLTPLFGPGRKLDPSLQGARRSLFFTQVFLEAMDLAQPLLESLTNGGEPGPERPAGDLIRLMELERPEDPSLGEESQALLLLLRLLESFGKGADQAAGFFADRLEENHAHSLVGVALGIPPAAGKK